MTEPTSLPARAPLDYGGVLRRRQDSRLAARAVRHRLVTHFQDIVAGRALGHKHRDLAFRESTLCIIVAPLIIFYNPQTRIVLSVLDGRRDLPSLLSDLA